MRAAPRRSIAAHSAATPSPVSPDTSSGPAPRPPNRARASFAQQPALAGGQLVDLREHDLRGDVFGPQPLVQLALLVGDAAAGVDQDDEQRQRAAGARVAFDQRLPRVALAARHLGVAVPGQIDQPQLVDQRPAGFASAAQNITSPRVRPGVFDVRARPLRPARRLSSVDLPTLERPEIAISGGPGGQQPAEVARLGDELGLGDRRER